MFIIWGHRQRRKYLGRVAEECLQCEEPRAHRAYELQTVPHLYLIQIGRGTRLGEVVRCEQCKAEVGVEAGQYTGYTRDRSASLEDLVDQTHPMLPERIAQRLDMEERVAAGEATPRERMQLIHEALLPAYPAAERRGNSVHIDLWLALAGLAIVPAGVAGHFVGIALVQPTGLWATTGPVWGTLVGAGVPGVVLLYLLATDPRRHFRRKTRPAVIRRLAPLQPELAEIEAAAQHYKTQGARLGKLIKPRRLHADVTAAIQNNVTSSSQG